MTLNVYEKYKQIEPYTFLYECHDLKINVNIKPYTECNKELWLFIFDSIPFAVCISENGDPKQLDYRDDLENTNKYLYIIHTLAFFYEQHTWKRILNHNIPRINKHKSKYRYLSGLYLI
jgi:hypothetical protein